MTPFATWLTAQLDAARARELAAATTYMQSKYQNPDIEARNLIHWAQAQARVTLLAEVRLQYRTTEALGITEEQEDERATA